jgi:hypothetical protein
VHKEKEDESFEKALNKEEKNCSDDGVVRIKFLERRWMLMSAECVEKSNYRYCPISTQNAYVE